MKVTIQGSFSGEFEATISLKEGETVETIQKLSCDGLIDRLDFPEDLLNDITHMSIEEIIWS